MDNFAGKNPVDKNSVEELLKNQKYHVKEFINFITVEIGLSPRTVKEYYHDLRIFLGFFMPHFNEELTLDTIDERTLREFLTYLKLDKSYTPEAINRKIATLKAYFSFLESEGYIKKNPMVKVKSAKLGKHLPKVLTENEIKLFFDALYSSNDKYNIRDRSIFEIFYATGMRISEVVGMNRGDIDFDKMTIKVKGKGDKERMVLVNESSVKALKEYLNIRPNVNTPALFISKKNTRLTSRMIEYIFLKYLEKTGINKSASPHTIRHSFATHMLERGSDLVTIKELLGHENLSTTQIYTNISMQHIRETYKRSHPRE